MAAFTKRVEFSDQRPFGDTTERSAWLVRYDAVSIPHPAEDYTASLAITLAYDVETGALVCAFTDPAPHWAKMKTSDPQRKFVNTGTTLSPARHAELQSTVVEVLHVFWKRFGLDPSRAGQIVIRPRFATSRAFKAGTHLPAFPAANVWLVEALGMVFMERQGLKYTGVVGQFRDGDLAYYPSSVFH